jgi:Cellulase (glycosyl hydrolase family 5)
LTKKLNRFWSAHDDAMAKQSLISCSASFSQRSGARNRRIEILSRSAILIGAFLILSLCVSCGVTAETPPPNLTPPAIKIPVNYFGLHILHLLQAKDTDWPDVSFGAWRLWDAHVSWNFLEPRKGQYNFSLLDEYIQIAKQKNVDLILTLAVTPPWADNGVHGGTKPPSDLGDWQAFVTTVAQRYAGKIHYYEILNEPDHSAWFTGTMQEAINMDAAAYTAIKAADPSNIVLSPPIDGDPDGRDWLDQFLKLGGGKYVDIYAFHFYVGGYPEMLVTKFQLVQTILAKYGEDKKLIWNTEAGWPFYLMTPDLASDYIVRAYIINWALGIRRLYLYAWDHPRLGLAPDGQQNTPMVEAYGRIAHWLQGSTMTHCQQVENGIWIANLTLFDGTEAKLAWYPDGATLLDPKHVGDAYLYENVNGTSEPIQKGGPHVHVSRSPILLKYH